ncbi:MAG: HAD family hydrolase [Thermoplasmatota archaeon]
MRWRVVSLDLDGTLVHPAAFNAAAAGLGFGPALDATWEDYRDGRIHLEEAFRRDVAHFDGLAVADVQEALRRSPAWTPGIARGIRDLHEGGAKVIVTTDQPAWLAEVTLEFGVDDLVCSPAPVRGGRIVADFVPRFAKWPNLEGWLSRNGMPPSEVAHVGNGRNDIPIFQHVGRGVAVFTQDPAVVAGRPHLLNPVNLSEVARLVLEEP